MGSFKDYLKLGSFKDYLTWSIHKFSLGLQDTHYEIRLMSQRPEETGCACPNFSG